MRRFPVLLLLCLAIPLAGLGPSARAAGEKRARLIEQGELLAQSCLLCHGPRGSSRQQAIPLIGGQNESYLILSLRGYREGTRPTSVMDRIAKGYSLREIEAIAAYFAAQPYLPLPQVTDPAKVARGESVHLNRCKRCHLESGHDAIDNDSPLLAGQRLGYLRYDIRHVQAGNRPVSLKMRSALLELSADDVDAVLNFYAAQTIDGAGSSK